MQTLHAATLRAKKAALWLTSALDFVIIAQFNKREILQPH
jgi:hypothetical protein